MASLKIENDRLKSLGDAQTFMREIIIEMNRGYKSGYGWEFNSDAEIPEEPKPVEVLDKAGVPLTVGDYVFAEAGTEDTAGHLVDVFATIKSIGEKGEIVLESDEYDLCAWEYEGADLVKKEKKEIDNDGDEDKGAPWNKPHDNTTKDETSTSAPSDTTTPAFKG